MSATNVNQAFCGHCQTKGSEEQQQDPCKIIQEQLDSGNTRYTNDGGETCKYCRHSIVAHPTQADRTAILAGQAKAQAGSQTQEHHAKRAHLEVYVVSGNIWGCKKMVGVRVNIYKLFASHNGYYDLVNNDVQASQKVSYDGDNLSFSVMFKSEANAASFVNSGDKLKNLPMMVEDQIRISDPAPYDIRGELKLYRATDYDPSTSDSPCTQRDDVRTANSATAGEPTEATDDLMKYQSVENYETRNPMISWYSCHIIDKSLSKKFASSPSNLLAGTWTPFHQLYDGLKVPDNVPGINISFVGWNDKRDAQMDNRYKVTIEIEFRNEDCEAALAPLLKVGSTKVSQLKYQTCIHVKEPAIAQQCLEWKSKRTAEHWRKYLQELEE